MTPELPVEETTVNDADDTGLPSEQVDETPDSAPVYRDQRKRYPWWVKGVNEPTTATDGERHRRMNPERLVLDLVSRFYHGKDRAEVVRKRANLGLPQYIGVDKTAALAKKGLTRRKRWLEENSPGFRHEDWALGHAAESVQYNLGFDFYELTAKSAFVNVCERFGLKPWKASKLEASQKIEKAAIALGACPWTKQSKTSLHYVAKALAAKLPSMARAMVFLDDLFGYGQISDPELIEKWWDLDLPEYGLDSHHR